MARQFSSTVKTARVNGKREGVFYGENIYCVASAVLQNDNYLEGKKKSKLKLHFLCDIVSNCAVAQAVHHLRMLDIRAKESGNMPSNKNVSILARRWHAKISTITDFHGVCLWYTIGSISVGRCRHACGCAKPKQNN